MDSMKLRNDLQLRTWIALFVFVIVMQLGWAQDAKPASPEAVKAAVTEIEKALAGKDPAVKVEALKKNSAIVDTKTIDAIAKGLREKEQEVKLAAIEALRFMPHPESRKSLEHWMHSERSLKDQYEVYAAALRAVGQFGAKESIELLVEDLWTAPDNSVMKARLLSLGRIRDRAAVEKLMDLLKSAGQNKVEPFMDDFRLSLMALTGVDQGKSRDLWTRWWQDNKDKFTMAKVEPELPKVDSYRWKSYWGEQMGSPRGEKRGERGTDRAGRERPGTPSKEGPKEGEAGEPRKQP